MTDIELAMALAGNELFPTTTPAPPAIQVDLSDIELAIRLTGKDLFPTTTGVKT